MTARNRALVRKKELKELQALPVTVSLPPKGMDQATHYMCAVTPPTHPVSGAVYLEGDPPCAYVRSIYPSEHAFRTCHITVDTPGIDVDDMTSDMGYTNGIFAALFNALVISPFTTCFDRSMIPSRYVNVEIIGRVLLNMGFAFQRATAQRILKHNRPLWLAFDEVFLAKMHYATQTNTRYGDMVQINRFAFSPVQKPDDATFKIIYELPRD